VSSHFCQALANPEFPAAAITTPRPSQNCEQMARDRWLALTSPVYRFACVSESGSTIEQSLYLEMLLREIWMNDSEGVHDHQNTLPLFPKCLILSYREDGRSGIPARQKPAHSYFCQVEFMLFWTVNRKGQRKKCRKCQHCQRKQKAMLYTNENLFFYLNDVTFPGTHCAPSLCT
jgi:hypothetical protein